MIEVADGTPIENNYEQSLDIREQLTGDISAKNEHVFNQVTRVDRSDQMVINERM